MPNQLPLAPTGTTRYLIQFTLRTIAPLHLGDGEARQMTAEEAKIALGIDDGSDVDPANRPWVDTVARAAASVAGDRGSPYIPGASIKGALRARILDSNPTLDVSTLALLNRVFGNEKAQPRDGEVNTSPGCAEFQHATAEKHAVVRFETRTAIDRVTKTVVDGKLFHCEYVNPPTQFKASIVLPKASAEEAAAVQALLKTCVQARPLVLGAQGRAGWGRVVVEDAVEVHALTDTGRQLWWDAPLDLATGTAPNWRQFTTRVQLPAITLTAPMRTQRWTLKFTFDGPFAAADPGHHKQRGDASQANIVARQRDKRPLLPATSFLGSLRSQAERILRTLGIDTAQGHDAPAAPASQPPGDLDSVLFGCAGWRGLVGLEDDLLGTRPGAEIEQHMIALCRVTGGVKDGALFKIKGWASPTLQGALTLDVQRLRNKAINAEAALGLLHLTLFDLASGDISFGLGRSKGWGWVKADDKLLNATYKAFIAQALNSGDGEKTVQNCVAALGRLAVEQPSRDLPASEVNAMPAAPNTALPKLPTLLRDVNTPGSEFHNPYHFLPFAKLHGAPSAATDESVSDQAQKSKHGHQKYEADRFSGTLTVKLTTVTPLVIGAARHNCTNRNAPVGVEQFEYEGQPAIPGTSLRGMLSGLLEPMSGSALRVIDGDAMLAVRMQAEGGKFLPYKGVIVEQPRPTDTQESPSELMVEVVPPNERARVPSSSRPLPVGMRLKIDASAIELLYALADDRWRHVGKGLDLSDPEVLAGSKIHVAPERRPHPTAKGVVDLLPAIDRVDSLGPLERRNNNPKLLGTRARLMSGQIVYFSCDAGREIVRELAWSQIYRRGAWSTAPHDPGALNLRRFIGLDPDERRRLPMGRRQDQGLHAAEWMLGMVEDKAQKREPALAFAGKIAVSMAKSTSDQVRLCEPTVLKELSSPKPPSPALYIRHAGQARGRITKDDLVKRPDAFRLQGTKTYLHAHRDHNGNVIRLDEMGAEGGFQATEPWRSHRTAEGPEEGRITGRQVLVQPIEAGQSFNFEIRFDNLSHDELSLLCAAVHPSTKYTHKLGMGRPIGLGSVKLKLEKLELEDRTKRYRTAAQSPPKIIPNAGQLAKAGMSKLYEHDPKLHDALLVLGEPKHVTAPVHYPQLAGSNLEVRSYAWWGTNDDPNAGTAQSLSPIESAPSNTFDS
jgi:CRISPR/Cas system CSM-associated protein Csm3 (group 7 of RAMP superfamily)